MSDGRPQADERYVVPGLQRGLEALRLFSRDKPSLSAPEIAAALDLPRATVFRLIHTLEMMGFLQKEPGAKRYHLGPSVLGIGFEYLASLDVVDVGRSELEKLRDQTGLSAHLAIRDGRDVIYVARFAARSAISGSVNVGTRLPAHGTVMGRALLACLSDAEIRALYGDGPLERYSEQTPTTTEALIKLLHEDRKRGYVAGSAFFEAGVTAIAAAVRDHAGQPAAAINLTAVGQAVDEESLHGAVRERICAAAERISGWLSGRQVAPGAAADESIELRSIV